MLLFTVFNYIHIRQIINVKMGPNILPYGIPIITLNQHQYDRVIYPNALYSIAQKILYSLY